MISKIIKNMRMSSGYNQAQLAEKIGIAQTTLSGYETNYSNPNFDIVEKIAKSCDFDIVFVDKNSGEQITSSNKK